MKDRFTQAQLIGMSKGAQQYPYNCIPFAGYLPTLSL